MVQGSNRTGKKCVRNLFGLFQVSMYNVDENGFHFKVQYVSNLGTSTVRLKFVTIDLVKEMFYDNAQ